MRGITGVLLTGASSGALDEALLWRMTDSLAHRGPDDRGIHLDRAAGVGLGHRRLSIIELSELGHQPMAATSSSSAIRSTCGRSASPSPPLSPQGGARLISGEVVRRFVDEHFGRRRDRSGIPWTLFCLMFRYRRWLLGERSFPS